MCNPYGTCGQWVDCHISVLNHESYKSHKSHENHENHETTNIYLYNELLPNVSFHIPLFTICNFTAYHFSARFFMDDDEKEALNTKDCAHLASQAAQSNLLEADWYMLYSHKFSFEFAKMSTRFRRLYLGPQFTFCIPGRSDFECSASNAGRTFRCKYIVKKHYNALTNIHQNSGTYSYAQSCQAWCLFRL